MVFTLADGGIETALVDRLQQELPEFAAFVLLSSAPGRAALRAYYEPFAQLAVEHGMPVAFDTPTWRANPDWGALLGYDAAALDLVQHDAVRLVRDAVAEVQSEHTALVSGCVGPRFDDFVADQRMSPETARAYHEPQVRALTAAGADRIIAVTMIDTAEALGVVQAARAVGSAVAVSFTVGSDGLLPSGHTLAGAIAEIDAHSGGYPIGYFVNCAHPSEVQRAAQLGACGALPGTGQAALRRVVGVRLNAALHGDDGVGDPPETFGAAVAALRGVLPNIETFGGCCGTDVPHVAEMAARLAPIG